MGLLTGPFWLGAAVRRLNRFLPACLTGAAWHLTMTRECSLPDEEQAIQTIARTKCSMMPSQEENHMMKNVAVLSS